MHLFTRTKIKITIDDTPLARGGEGEIHRILDPPSFSGFCVKIYIRKYQSHKRERKITYFVNNPLKGAGLDRNQSFNICFPVETVYRDDRFVGFIMPLAFLGSKELYQFCLPVPKDLDPTWVAKYDRATVHGIEARLKLCVNVAAAIDIIHRTGRYVLVDLKPQNILVTIDGKVSIVDLDSVQIVDVDKVTFPAKFRLLNTSPTKMTT